MSALSVELQRITRRRGSFLGCMAFAVVIALIAFIAGDEQDESLWSNVLAIGLVFGGTIVGALAGSYDQAQGTMRYLVLTGTPRSRLVGVRVPGVAIALTLMAVPALLVGLIAMVTHDGNSAAAVARTLGGSVLLMLAWGLVSLTVGTMLRSNGAGIAVALVLFLAGSLLTEFVRQKISRSVGDYLLPNVGEVVGALGHTMPWEPKFTIGLGAAAAVLALWLAAFLTASILRVRRDEY